MSSKEEESSFALSGTDNSFNSKSADIFASFDAIEAKHNAVQKTIKEDKSLYKEDPTLDWRKTECDREGFKRPGLPAPRSRSPVHPRGERGDQSGGRGRRGYRGARRTPDHVSNPDGWTKYDLSDVPELNDRSNSRAALSFLSGLRARGEEEEEEEEGAEVGKHLFKAPPSRPAVPPSLPGPDGPLPPAFGPSKRVLPEYVVGGGGGTRRTRPRPAASTAAECGAVGLNHLDDTDDVTSGTVSIPDPASLFASFKDDKDNAPTTFKKSRSRQTRKKDPEVEPEEDEDETPIFRSKRQKIRGLKSRSAAGTTAHARDTRRDSGSGSGEDDWAENEDEKKDASDDELNQVD